MEIRSSILKLEADLAASEKKLHDIIKRSPIAGFDMTDYHTARQENLRLQRELSLAKNEETALRLDWEAPWDAGAPIPHVFTSGDKAILIYYVNEPDPAWDGTYANVISPTDVVSRHYALVEFSGCYASKFGGPNEEALERHPLWGKGLEFHSAHKIESSKWIAEYKKRTKLLPEMGIPIFYSHSMMRYSNALRRNTKSTSLMTPL